MTLIRFEDAVPPISQAGGGSTQGDARSLAWRREMESAQLALWLDQPAIGPGASRNVDTSVAAPMRVHVSSLVSAGQSTAVAAAGSPDAAAYATDTSIATTPALHAGFRAGRTVIGPTAATEPPTTDVKPAPVKLLEQLAAAILELTGMAVAIAPSPQQVQAILPATAPALSGNEAQPAVDPLSGRSDARPVATAARDAEDPVRLHCRLGAEGVQVWIGSSAVAAVNAEALGAHLRLVLARQSLRLSSFIHNGQPVPIDGGSPSRLFPTKPNEESKWPLDL